MSELFDTPVEEVTPAPLPLPGASLRAARQSQGYSLAEVAQVLKFGVRQLEALENDDYSTLQGATFLRGFVRSYARYLRLDEAPLLAALEPQAPLAVAEMHVADSMNAEMPTGVQDPSKRVYWLAGFVLLLGGVAWFAWQGQDTSATLDKAAEPAAELAAPTPVAVPEATAEASVTVAPTPTVIAPAVSADAAAPAAATPAADVPPAAPNPNERLLQLSFGGVSWVEVRDASNRILYSGNSTPDSRQAVRGLPPFQLVIGNAQSVKLRYEDRTIDLQPYTRVDVARLTLDDNTK